MSIEKMMCLSTGHIEQSTAEALGLGILNEDIDINERDEETPEWFARSVIYPHGEYGWLICIAGDVAMDEEFRQQAPKDLLDCIVHADDNGCEWLLLDRDADLIDDLPQFDW